MNILKLLTFPLAAATIGMGAVATPAETRSPVRETSPPTVVHDQAALDRLRGNSGITLQWVSFTYPRDGAHAPRGQLSVFNDGDTIRISGTHREQQGDGHVSINGVVTEIGSDYFIFDGRIEISGTPDVERRCVKNGLSRFAITQNRRYWRMREFEWCDSLTDYIDIYY